MKKLILIIAVLAAGAAFAQDAEYSIFLTADTSTAILPPRDNRNVNIDGAWTTNSVVTNGYVFRVLSTRQDYMILTGGTTHATNYPTGTSGQVETNGTCTAIHCNYIAKRVVAEVGQEGDAPIWYHTGDVATTNGGRYAAFEAQQFRTDHSGKVSAISTSDIKLNIWDK
jgi:hypothetical protein